MINGGKMEKKIWRYKVSTLHRRYTVAVMLKSTNSAVYSWFSLPWNCIFVSANYSSCSCLSAWAFLFIFCVRDKDMVVQVRLWTIRDFIYLALFSCLPNSHLAQRYEFGRSVERKSAVNLVALQIYFSSLLLISVVPTISA